MNKYSTDQIRAIRKARGWLQADLARFMGLARRETISDWERGVSEPHGPARVLLELLASEHETHTLDERDAS